MILSAITSLVAAYLTARFAIKKIIYVSHTKHLFDEPSEDRKIHLKKTPNLGGVGIFVSVLFTVAFSLNQYAIAQIGYLLAASVILFTLGLTDDLVGLNPLKKLAAQIIVAVITTILADYRIENLHLFGLGTLPYWISIVFSSLIILFMINAINLIDGINALAASVCLVSCTGFAIFFYVSGDNGFLYVSAALAGALGGFLIYNITPAKIFMGDTGSLFLGFILSVLSIRFYNMHNTLSISQEFTTLFNIHPALFLFSLLVIPFLDTSRVFILRLLKKQSPFTADRNHLHHLLLNLNFNHLQATGILVSVNLICILLAFQLRSLKVEFSLLLVLAFTLILISALWFLSRKKSKEFIPVITRTNTSLHGPKETVTLLTPFPENLVAESKSSLMVAEEEISAN